VRPVNETLTYVYCLVRSGRRPTVSRRSTMRGVPGARETRAVPAGEGLWLIVASVPASDYGEGAITRGLQDLEWVGQRAMAHEAVVEQFLSARAVLPMQLFTLFNSDERAIHHVDRQRGEIDAVLKRIEGRLEFGLRLMFDEQSLRDAIDARARGGAASAGRAPRGGIVTLQEGSAYLARKRDLLDVQRVQLREARAAADRLFAALTRDAADARRRAATEQAAPGSRLLLDAAFLVSSSRARSFRAAVSRRAREIGTTGVVVSLTGPWPPYNFISPAARPAPSRRSAQSGRGTNAR
jgi:hypothetical protein